jgi:hypothetical protein
MKLLLSLADLKLCRDYIAEVLRQYTRHESGCSLINFFAQRDADTVSTGRFVVYALSGYVDQGADEIAQAVMFAATALFGAVDVKFEFTDKDEQLTITLQGKTLTITDLKTAGQQGVPIKVIKTDARFNKALADMFAFLIDTVDVMIFKPSSLISLLTKGVCRDANSLVLGPGDVGPLNLLGAEQPSAETPPSADRRPPAGTF